MAACLSWIVALCLSILSGELPALQAEVRERKPKLIVCQGKKVFDLFCPHKLNADSVQGGFFYSAELDCNYCLADPIARSLQAPEHIERMLLDLKNIRAHLDELRGNPRQKLPVNRYELRTLADLRQMRAHCEGRGITHYAVDCEWQGQTFVDGTLRMYQFAFSETAGAVVHFYDEHGQWQFDCGMDEIKAELQPWFNAPDVRFIGHNIVADLLWMENHLGIHVLDRVVFDTMFARNTVHESADLKLERQAVAYTDLGRYDLPLTIWKKRPGNHSINRFHETPKASRSRSAVGSRMRRVPASIFCTVRVLRSQRSATCS